MGNWHLPQISQNMLNEDTPATETVQSDDLSAIERFVREIISNSRDSHLDRDQPVRVAFHFSDLVGESKEHLLAAIKADQLQEAYSSIAVNPESLKRIFLGVDPDKVMDPKVPLHVLCVLDSNTKGLIGPEYGSRDYEEKHDLRFLGLCRSFGKNSTSATGDNSGSWGYGKSVLWAANHSRIVLFYSRLSKSWLENGTEVTTRLYGHTMLPDYYDEDDQCHSGQIVFGENPDANGNVCSLWNDAALEMAQNIGIDGFYTDEPGTSIIVAGFRPFDTNEDLGTESIVDSVRSAVEKFFWPAILDNELIVEIFHNGERRPIDIMGNPHIRPFINLYRKLLKEKLQPGQFDLIDVQGSRGFPLKARIAVAALVFQEGGEECELINRIAKIRGTRMVIDYREPRRTTLTGTGAIGLALAGELLTSHYDTDAVQQERLGKLLLDSEPISHHKWDERSKRIGELGARPVIRRINREIDLKFRDLIQEKREEPAAEYSTLLAKILPFGGSGEGPGIRGGDVRYETITEMRKQIDDGLCTYEHAIRFFIKPKSDWKPVEGRRQPTHFRFRAEFHAMDEAGKRIDMSDDIRFRIVRIETTEYDSPDGDATGKHTDPRPDSDEIIRAVDNKYRVYEVHWKSNKVPIDMADVIQIESRYSWHKGRED